jgi:hypothetical protein
MYADINYEDWRDSFYVGGYFQPELDWYDDDDDDEEEDDNEEE